MDIKVNQVSQINQIETAQKVAPTDNQFKFTLAAAVGDAELQDKLTQMLNDIVLQGEIIAKHTDVREMKKYRMLIKDFMNEIVNRSHKFTRENFLDRRGRHRVYGMIRLVDEKLDELAEALVADELNHIDILNKVDEIRGLLIDIIT